MSPEWPYLILPAYIPNIEFDILVCDSFDIEPHGRNSCDILVEFQLV